MPPGGAGTLAVGGSGVAPQVAATPTINCADDKAISTHNQLFIIRNCNFIPDLRPLAAGELLAAQGYRRPSR
jgi:hypothetical protein